MCSRRAVCAPPADPLQLQAVLLQLLPVPLLQVLQPLGLAGERLPQLGRLDPQLARLGLPRLLQPAGLGEGGIVAL